MSVVNIIVAIVVILIVLWIIRAIMCSMSASRAHDGEWRKSSTAVWGRNRHSKSSDSESCDSSESSDESRWEPACGPTLRARDVPEQWAKSRSRNCPCKGKRPCNAGCEYSKVVRSRDYSGYSRGTRSVRNYPRGRSSSSCSSSRDQ